MSIVTSAEVQKNFARYREQALADPVVVVQYGKPSVVINSATEYERMKELDRRVMRLEEMSDARIEEMLSFEILQEHRYSIAEIECLSGLWRCPRSGFPEWGCARRFCGVRKPKPVKRKDVRTGPASSSQQ